MMITIHNCPSWPQVYRLMLTVSHYLVVLTLIVRE